MSTLLVKFKDMKGESSWKGHKSIDYDDFSKHLMLPKSEALKEVFDSYDRVSSNT